MSFIPNNTEKYISFSLEQLRFIDSAHFLLASLDKLVAANPPRAFQITAQHEPNRERRELLMRRGVYPYEYMDTWDRFTEPKLPSKEAFYSKLSDAHISDEDYAHAQKIWATFGCKTLEDYSNLYCRTDVLLLEDVFETFRKMCLRQYGLDPAHYSNSPGLSWDALLKKTGVERELLTDYDQHLFIEKGMHGGISMASKRHAKANNPLVDGYDGFILEVDLAVPRRPTKCAQCISADTGAHGGSEIMDVRVSAQPLWRWGAPTEVQKLVPNLRNTDCHVLHYRNLQLYTSLGMRLTKVHRALRFDKSPGMEPYIRMNTELRKKAASDIEKDLYKLMNNSVFGKTMENLRKRVHVKLVRSHEEDKLKRLIASPAFARANIFDDDLAAIQVHKSNLVLNRPVYVGMSILDLSKHLMYDFYYNQLKAQDGESCHLLYTDTGSLLLEIETEDVYKDMVQNQTLYDTSDYHQDLPLYSSANKKVLGKLKDECAGQAIAQ